MTDRPLPHFSYASYCADFYEYQGHHDWPNSHMELLEDVGGVNSEEVQMRLNLDGGPTTGSYISDRAPFFLRAITDGEGRMAVLAQLDDYPSPEDAVHVYRQSGRGIACSFGANKGCVSFYEYEHLADVDGELVRENEAWRDWVQARPKCEGKIATGNQRIFGPTGPVDHHLVEW